MNSSNTGKGQEIVVFGESKANSAELVKAPSASLAESLRQADEYRQHTKAGATQTAYKGDWERFLAWAASNEVSPLPVAPDNLCAHLTWLAKNGYSVATLERFLSAGSHYHHAVDLDFPRGSLMVKKTLKGIRQELGVKRVKKAPLGLKTLADACDRIRSSGSADALRDCAMLTTGWFGMLRSANLVAIQRGHVRLVQILEDNSWLDEEERPNGLILHLPKSKTDQAGEGRDVGIFAQDDERVCPILSLAEYLRSHRFAPQELIFPVSRRTVSRVIKRLVANPDHEHKSLKEIDDCESCSAAVRRFASHSLRRGSATTQAQRGTPERDIMRHGGWQNERVARGYIEHATIFQNNPTKGLTSKKDK